MRPVDNPSSPIMHSAREFYDLLAPQYDAMTGFENRFEKERPAFGDLVERYGIRRALDAGSGSGFHSILLAQLGVDVTALDLSSEMVRLTEENARKYQVKINVLSGAFTDVPLEWSESFDGVFVMGNSLPHLLSHDELQKAIKRLVGVLRRGGVLITQCLNYERILARKDRIMSRKELKGAIITREYEYDSDGIRFSVITQLEGPLGKRETRETVRLRPVLPDELVGILRELGVNARLFGNIMLDHFLPSASVDLVVVATKP